MPLYLKRTFSQSAMVPDQEDQDHVRYTRIRILEKNGAYEDEVQMLRARNKELEARVRDFEDGNEDELQILKANNRKLRALVQELEDDIDLILNAQNSEMDDVVKLKEEVHLYYQKYRAVQSENMGLEEDMAKLRAGGHDSEHVPKPSKKLDADAEKPSKKLDADAKKPSKKLDADAEKPSKKLDADTLTSDLENLEARVLKITASALLRKRAVDTRSVVVDGSASTTSHSVSSSTSTTSNS
ncbi:hypothetical protein F5880DRAFT_1619602, partial [Lentinula raphanica]